jgi:glycosyltransferase 2 family protein
VSTGRRQTIAMLAVGIVISGGFLWLAFRNVDSEGLARAFVSVDPVFLLGSAAALGAGLMLRARRWRRIANAPPAELRNFTRATNVGALANLLLPGRVGEVVRIVTMAHLSGTRLAEAVASALLDRMIDVLMLAASALALCISFPFSSTVTRWLMLVVSAGLAMVALFIAFAGSARKWEAPLARFAERKMRRWRVRPEAFLRELRVTISGLADGRRALKLLVTALFILVADCGAVAGSLWALHLPVPIIGVLMLWVCLAAGSLLPSAPGYVGIYQLAAVWALSSFSVSPASAVAVAVVLQVSTLVVAFVAAGSGFWGLLRAALRARA